MGKNQIVQRPVRAHRENVLKKLKTILIILLVLGLLLVLGSQLVIMYQEFRYIKAMEGQKE